MKHDIKCMKCGTKIFEYDPDYDIPVYDCMCFKCSKKEQFHYWCDSDVNDNYDERQSE